MQQREHQAGLGGGADTDPELQNQRVERPVMKEGLPVDGVGPVLDPRRILGAVVGEVPLHEPGELQIDELVPSFRSR